jgi:hypothetical protein
MATTQPWATGGRLLAGIGGANTSAPQASDVNATLGLIRQNNDFARAGGNNVGLQALQGLGGLAQAYQQNQQAERQKAFQQKYGNAFKSSDRNAMRDLAAEFPDQFEHVQKGMGFIDDDHRTTMGDLAMNAQVAAGQGPEAFGNFLKTNATELNRIGVNPSDVGQIYQQNPQGASDLFGTLAMFSLGPKGYLDALDKREGRDIDRGKLAETERSNRASEGLQARGQDISSQNSLRTSGGSVPASVREYQYFQSLGPDQQKTYLRVRGRPEAMGDSMVQLADGRTVSVTGKLHGSGASAFYEGVDDAGNMVRVPASAIAAPPTSAAAAQNSAMKKDLDSIEGASSGALGFMTGITGGTGKQALGADVRSRLSGGEQRQLYNAAQRIQGRMQNQGVAAARDMGASGINTVAEAKMYFQGMPQFDSSSPEAAKRSAREIREYTDNYNQQYNVNLGGSKSQQQAPQPAQQPAQPHQQGGFSSLWGD